MFRESDGCNGSQLNALRRASNTMIPDPSLHWFQTTRILVLRGGWQSCAYPDDGPVLQTHPFFLNRRNSCAENLRVPGANWAAYRKPPPSVSFMKWTCVTRSILQTSVAGVSCLFASDQLDAGLAAQTANTNNMTVQRTVPACGGIFIALLSKLNSFKLLLHPVVRILRVCRVAIARRAIAVTVSGAGWRAAAAPF